MDLKELFMQALKEHGVEVEEPKTIVHWADSKVKRGFVSSEFPDNYYLNCSTEQMGLYLKDDMLVATDEDDLLGLQAIAKHFQTSIEPLEI